MQTWTQKEQLREDYRQHIPIEVKFGRTQKRLRVKLYMDKDSPHHRGLDQQHLLRDELARIGSSLFLSAKNVAYIEEVEAN